MLTPFASLRSIMGSTESRPTFLFRRRPTHAAKLSSVWDTSSNWTPLGLRRLPSAAVPARFGVLRAGERRRGELRLVWEPPARHAPVTGYRIERTREGRHYELLGETADTCFNVPRPMLRDPWFYRVTAFNLRGAGRAKSAWFYERHPRHCRPGRPDPRMSLSLPVPVAPGLRVSISELA